MVQLWSDKKRTIFALPLSFTKYTLTDEKLLVRKGFLSISEDEIRLYRITDVSFHQNLRDRIWGVGNIHICSADKTLPEFDIMRVKNARAVMDQISEVVENVRNEKRVGVNEFMADGADFPHPPIG